ncbi:MAG TPA: bifunctional diguanylate cyclase/phosphodiesterase [Solirubrobacteraceae bacterium]|jgi:diguanylate cyclase (GGDEF)-like protein|nr:bifunctional diguanylate cyclase/phosphodiesterase [Solirubrobacteraceae bacterium]
MRPTPTAAEGREPVPSRVGRLRHPRRLLPHRTDGPAGSAVAFGVRLLATVTLTLALIGVAGFLFLERTLADRQIGSYAATQRGDAKAIEHESATAASPKRAILEIEHLLDGIAQREGTLEALLIDQRHVVVAANSPSLEGQTDVDTPIAAALREGRAYSGRETDAHKDTHNFEFVLPVNLPNGRFAYAVVYDHRVYDAQLQEVRLILALIGLLGLLGGSAVFYVVGGRRLMRDHRTVLLRATRDGLTDLPNARAFQDEFPDALAAAARYQDPLALVLLDVDDFKLSNQRHGHEQGDAILRVLAGVLRSCRPGDRPFRTGGDEFALLLAHTDADGARALLRRLSRNFAEVGVEVSVGVSSLRAGLSADTMRAEAETALYEAGRRGGNRVVHFDDIREQVVVTTQAKKEALLRVLEEGRMDTVFQPIWNFETGVLLALEALSRPDPAYGLQSPAEAFDVAEHLGRVHALDVLCATNALLAAPESEPGVLLFVNLSPVTLDLDAEGDDWLRDAVHAAGRSPAEVVIEVTERFGGRTESVVTCLQRLRAQGFKIAVDDVGTGNSGLEMLRMIDAEFVKLDRSVVVAAPTEPGARAVLMAMATFARQTGAFVIAEGIEDADTLEFLRGVGQPDSPIIQGGQGFYLGKPSRQPTGRSPAIVLEPEDGARPTLGASARGR